MRTTCFGGGVSRYSSEQVWTGLQWWPPDVTNSLGGYVQRGMDMSRGVGSPYHVTYPIMHVMLLTRVDRQSENITFPQLPFRAIMYSHFW